MAIPTANLWAQAPPDQTAAKADLAISFLANRSIQSNTTTSFWAEGGSIELGVDAFRGLGLAASVAGFHASSVGTGGVPLSLVISSFGPRYRWHAARRSSVFGEAMVGEANAFGSVFPADAGAESSANSLAVQCGGGLDIVIMRHLTVRAVQAQWLRTQLANGVNDRQNSLQLGAGLVVRFAR